MARPDYKDLDLSKTIVIPKELDEIFSGEFVENDTPTKDNVINDIASRKNNQLCCKALSYIILRNSFIYEDSETGEEEYKISCGGIFDEISKSFSYNRVILVLAHEVIENQTQLANPTKLCGKFDPEVAQWACNVIKESENFSFKDYEYTNLIKYDIGSPVLNLFLRKAFIEKKVEPKDYFQKKEQPT